MSSRRLIFSFKNGINLALNEQKVADGAIIHFDLNFGQVDMVYEGPLLEVVGQEEVRDRRPVLEFRSKPEEASTKKGKRKRTKKEAQTSDIPAQETGKIGSMVLTAEGELVGVPTKRAPLTRAQRRRRSRQKHLALNQIEEKQSGETVTGCPPPPYEGALLGQAVRDVLPHTEERQQASGSSRVDVSFEHASAEPYVGVFQGAAPIVQRDERHPEVEPYVPPFVLPRELQIIPEGEWERSRRVRMKNFERFERIHGKYVNILEGLELHTDVFSVLEQEKIVKCISDLRDEGRAGALLRRTYSEPRRWMKGKGRITIQFGCCYNYAYDNEGNPPGIIRHDEVDPIPPLLKKMIKRMVSWRVLPADCVPNSCIVNIYKEGDCIPPHIDHRDFVRPFCTVSFLSECNIMFGRELPAIGPGEFHGPVHIPLPVGSVLVLKGNGADLAKHCVSAVPQKRISITFRKMDCSKVPFGYRPDPELEGLRPLEL